MGRLCGMFFLPDKEKKRGKNVWDDFLINLPLPLGRVCGMMGDKRYLLWEDCVVFF